MGVSWEGGFDKAHTLTTHSAIASRKEPGGGVHQPTLPQGYDTRSSFIAVIMNYGNKDIRSPTHVLTANKPSRRQRKRAAKFNRDHASELLSLQWKVLDAMVLCKKLWWPRRLFQRKVYSRARPQYNKLKPLRYWSQKDKKLTSSLRRETWHFVAWNSTIGRNQCGRITRGSACFFKSISYRSGRTAVVSMTSLTFWMKDSYLLLRQKVRLPAHNSKVLQLTSFLSDSTPLLCISVAMPTIIRSL